MLVMRPDGSDRGRLSIDMMTTFARARRQNARAYVLRPSVVSDEALFALTTDDVTVVRPRGVARVPGLARWCMTAAADLAGQRLATGATSFWQQLYVELRRHAGDERLPSTLRGGLRRMAHGAFSRATGSDTSAPFPRRLLREAIETRLPHELQAKAQRMAATFGIAAGSRMVALELRSRLDPFGEAIDFLVDSGYTVVRIGSPVAGPARRAGVIDLAHAQDATPLLDVFVMLESQFVVCEGIDLQAAAYLTNTPCLLVNATDPIASYPVRADGLYTLRTAIHLDTGDRLAPSDLLDDAYFRERRNFGFRDTPAGEILAAVREMHEGLQNGWSETAAQAAFRDHVMTAAAALAARTPQLVNRGPDDGFIGDGRLARAQAERML